MMELCTRHAARRAQQRSISADLVDLLWSYGSEMRHGGADVLYFDHAARRRITVNLGEDALRQVGDGALGCYAVVGDDGRLVTVGHRHSRFRRDARMPRMRRDH